MKNSSSLLSEYLIRHSVQKIFVVPTAWEARWAMKLQKKREIFQNVFVFQEAMLYVTGMGEYGALQLKEFFQKIQFETEKSPSDLKSARLVPVFLLGFAGACQSHLKVGDVVLDSRYISPDWQSHLKNICLDLGILQYEGRIKLQNQILFTPQDKRSSMLGSDALAIDMETQLFFDVAQPLRIPLSVIRVISDTSEQTVPRASRYLGPRGELSASFFCDILRHPWDIGDWIKLSNSSAAAGKVCSHLVDKILKI